jgi:molybdenum cofactor cytidylyltransferase
MRSRPTIVLLAAGPGRRGAGSPARLAQPLAGSSVLATTLAHAIQTRLPVLLVTTESLLPLVADQIAHRDTIVVSAADTLRGSGHLVAVGVTERASSPGWLVLPGDLPMVLPSTLLAVAEALDEHPVAYAQYRGRRGHPVGFAAELYSELALLSGDDGVRRLIARYPGFAAEVDDPGVRSDAEADPAPEPSRAAGGAV